ncbi:hypothetical protein C8Q73DRAFT_711231 [Cubamyces lactineus]|nr:hypothetical protein C8Q73DRAFT_711231 [Cubamyces lactineus]
MASATLSHAPATRSSPFSTIGTIDSLKNADPFGTPVNKPNPVYSRKVSVGRPITGCVANLRDLAVSSRGLYRAIRDTRGSVSRLNILGRDAFEAEWTAFAERYKNLLDDSDLAASQLIAIIKVFLVLQSKKGDAPEDDMISELDSLRQTLTERQYDLSSQCNKLREDVGRDYVVLSQAIDSEGALCPSNRVNSNDSKTPDPSSKPNRTDTNSSVVVPKVFILWRIFNAIRLRRVRNPETQNRTDCRPVKSKPSRMEKIARKKRQQRKPKGADRPSTARQGTQSSQASAASTTLEAIKDILEKLEQQEPLFDAFPELAKHLRNEIDAYLRAFEAVKAYPARRRKALDEAQTRVVASSKFWRECLIALNAELSAVELDGPGPVVRLV